MKYLVFKGRVQGVGFRYFCQNFAIELGIRGYVRNLPNGDVEAVIDADQSCVDRLVAKLESLGHVHIDEVLQYDANEAGVQIGYIKGRFEVRY